MKVIVNPDGSFELDVKQGDASVALEFIQASQSSAKEKKVSQSRSESMLLAATKVEDSHLNALQYRTWEFLCENDNSDGIHVSQLAKAFGINRAAANTRLVVLTNMGYAKRVAKGYYRALTPEE